ncbi:hypothetical protein [Methanosarcina sp. KYL-1]|uniref:hypothetical protein n=1 Tax=Methanosarcina sp. KYL-1 TaxID=2602068 RepID=UPI0021014C24
MEKKENMEKTRAYKKVMEQNKKINRVNLVVLAAGLILTFLNIKVFGIDVGYYLLWTGVFVFFVTAISGISASWSARRPR